LDRGRALLKKGTFITVQLSGDRLDVSPASQDFEWQGQQHYLDFDVSVRKDSPERSTRLKFDVSVDGFVLARLRLDLTIEVPSKLRWPWLRRRTYAFSAASRTAFASYAAEDRPRVLDRIAAIRIAIGINIFTD